MFNKHAFMGRLKLKKGVKIAIFAISDIYHQKIKNIETFIMWEGGFTLQIRECLCKL